MSFPHRGLHGEEHIGARVAVGHGKDIQGIDIRRVAFEPERARAKDPFQFRTIYLSKRRSC